MIFITGGAGFIGSHAAVELLEAGHEIVVADTLINSQSEAIRRIKGITGKDFPFYQVNLLDYKKLNEIFSLHPISAVMHFAGLKSAAESETDPLAYYRNNLGGTLYLCEIMKKHGVKKIIFSSSAMVYDVSDEMPLIEESPLGASNPYGRSKSMTEEVLQDLIASDPEWRIAVLRYFNPIGAHESGLLGEEPKGKPNNLMPFITQVAVGRRKVVQVFGDDYETHDGTGVRDYIHIVDLVKGHVKALDYLETHKGLETFNLGTGRGYSVFDLIRTFSLATGIDIPYQIAPRRSGDAASNYADPSKAESYLDWKAERDLMQMCRDSWNWQAKNPFGYKESTHPAAAFLGRELDKAF